MWKMIWISVLGASYGLLSAAGVFTALAAVGLVPRFAGRTRTVAYGLKYESMVVLGAVTGCIFSVFDRYCQIGAWGRRQFPGMEEAVVAAGILGQICYGFFAGCFVGCLALAIAEMLDSIPILGRRIGFRQGIGIAVFSMACGKLAGALFYFVFGLERTCL
ncbi:MAG: stage V sporulation protein AB [Acetatifactor sp.]|nr:stage V sporulation protein AB [Acetatifactor sp.]